MPKVASSRREQYLQDRRDQILEAAVRVFGKKGFAGTNVADIAEAANVGKGTLYLYFSSKEDIFTSILQERSFLPRLTQLTHDDDMPVEEVLTGIAKAYMKDIDYYLPIFRLAISESNRFPETAKKIYNEIIHNGIYTLAEFFTARKKAGKMSGIENPANAARAFMGMLVTYMITQRLMGGEAFDPVPEDDWVDEVVSIFLKGVQS